MTSRGARIAPVAVWVAAAAIIAISVVWGRRYQSDTPAINLGAAPLVGRDPLDGWDWRFGWGLVAAAAVAAAVVVGVARGWWWRVRLRVAVVASSVAAAAFAVALAVTDGADGVLRGAAHETEYLVNLRVTPPAAEFLRTFVERIDDYSVHVRGHPPGFVLVLKFFDAVGAGGEWSTAILSIVAATAVPAAVLVAVWAVAGADWVPRVAPVLVVAPYALWMVTSADAVYAAVGAWAVAATAMALRLRAGRRVVAAAVAGLLYGGLLFLTYGGAVFLVVPVVLLVAVAGLRTRRTLVVAGTASLALVAVTAAFAAFGFWWFAGAAETRLEYWEGTAALRTWQYFAIANVAVAFIALGPLTLAGLSVLRDRRVWVLVGGALLALAVAHLSQYSRAEVERIWLLFFPWVAVAGGAVIAATMRSATLVALQGATAIVLQAALVSKW